MVAIRMPGQYGRSTSTNVERRPAQENNADAPSHHTWKTTGQPGVGNRWICDPELDHCAFDERIFECLSTNFLRAAGKRHVSECRAVRHSVAQTPKSKRIINGG
jgi:hypothetical protein